MQQRIESLGPKIEGLKVQDRSFNPDGSRFAYEPDTSSRTPMTQTVNIQTQPSGHYGRLDVPSTRDRDDP